MNFTAENIRAAHRVNEQRYDSFNGDPRATLSPSQIAERTVDEILARLETASEAASIHEPGAPATAPPDAADYGRSRVAE